MNRNTKIGALGGVVAALSLGGALLFNNPAANDAQTHGRFITVVGAGDYECDNVKVLEDCGDAEATENFTGVYWSGCKLQLERAGGFGVTLIYPSDQELVEVKQPVEVSYDPTCHLVKMATWKDRNPYGNVTPSPSPTASPSPTPEAFATATRIVISADNLRLRTGESAVLMLVAYNAAGKQVAPPPVRWESYDTRAVSVDANGKVIALSAARTSVIVYARWRLPNGKFTTSNFLTVVVNR